MKIALGLILAALAVSAWADDYVRGYTRKDGTYVPPHYRSTPDSSRANNYGSQGNVNPYNGERGYVNPHTPPAPRQPTYPAYPNPYR